MARLKHSRTQTLKFMSVGVVEIACASGEMGCVWFCCGNRMFLICINTKAVSMKAYIVPTTHQKPRHLQYLGGPISVRIMKHSLPRQNKFTDSELGLTGTRFSMKAIVPAPRCQ